MIKIKYTVYNFSKRIMFSSLFVGLQTKQTSIFHYLLEVIVGYLFQNDRSRL